MARLKLRLDLTIYILIAGLIFLAALTGLFILTMSVRNVEPRPASKPAVNRSTLLATVGVLQVVPDQDQPRKETDDLQDFLRNRDKMTEEEKIRSIFKSQGIWKRLWEIIGSEAPVDGISPQKAYAVVMKITDFLRSFDSVKLSPSTNPDRYSILPVILLEAMAKQQGLAFSEGQLERLSKATSVMKSRLATIYVRSTLNRKLAELSTLKSFREDLHHLMTPDQRKMIQWHPYVTTPRRICRGGGESLVKLRTLTGNLEEDVKTVLRDWARAGHLQPNQKPLVEKASRNFVRDLQTMPVPVENPPGIKFTPGSEDDYALRIWSLQLQKSALASLRGVVSEEQMAQMVVWEYSPPPTSRKTP